MSTTTAPRRSGLDPVTDFAAAFGRFTAARRADEPDWLRAARAAAFERFRANGLPSRRSELWRYTNLTSFSRLALELQPAAAEPRAASDLVEARRLSDAAATLVFVDGVWSRELSSKAPELPLRVDPLSLAIRETREDVQRLVTSLEGGPDRPFLDLNGAFFTDGALVRVPPGVELAGPVQLLFLQSGGGVANAGFPRVVVVLEPESRATLVEEHVAASAGVDLVAPVTHVHVRRGGALHHVRVQDVDRGAFHFGSVDVALEADAAWHGVTLQLGGAFARDEVRASYLGPGGDFALHALALADADRTVDVQADVVHSAVHCRSRQTYRGVVDDKARGVFNSRVAVERGAQGTDSGQSSRSLLLAGGAVADTKPQLEVLADDVRCFHGATVGQLDDDALFFLRARGIGAAEARALLTLAFAGEVVDAVGVPALRERLEAVLRERLRRA